MNLSKNKVLLLFSIFCLIKYETVKPMAAAEEIVVRAAEEGGMAAEELEAAGIRTALTEEVAKSMGVSVEDLGKMPLETQEAFVKQLSEQFSKLKPTIIEGKVQPFGSDLKSAMTSAKEQFKQDLKNFDLSSFKQDYFKGKFNADPLSFKPFTPELKPEIPGVKTEPLEKPSAQTQTLKENVNKASGEVIEARENLMYALTGDPERIGAAVKEANQAIRKVETANKALQDQAAKETTAAKDELASKQNITDKAEASENVQEKTANEELEKRRSADMEYKLAEDNYKGSPANRAAEEELVGNKLKLKKGKIEQLEEQLKTAKPEEKTAIQNELDKTRQSLREIRDKSTQGKVKNALEKRFNTRKKFDDMRQKLNATNIKEADIPTQYEKAAAEFKTASEKFQPESAEYKAAADKLNSAQELKAAYDDFKAADTEYNAAVDADKAASQLHEEKYKAWLEDGSFSVKKWGYKGYEAAKAKGIDVLSNVIAGFAFSIPNFITGALQGSDQRDQAVKNLEIPQSFGKMWLQIPAQLINRDVPSDTKYVYVRLDKKPDDKVTEHDSSGDEPGFLQHADLFISRDQYGNYTTAAIPDPSFPGFMVHLNTGFLLNADGTAFSVETPAVPVLQPAPATNLAKTTGSFREPLARILDELAGVIRSGVSKDIYQDFGKKTEHVAGFPLIADRLDSEKNLDQVFAGAKDQTFGSILNTAVRQPAQNFGNPAKINLSLAPFSAAPATEFTNLISQAGTKANTELVAVSKPYVAIGYYVYQTADTSRIKAIKEKYSDQNLARWIEDYVIVLGTDLSKSFDQETFLEPKMDAQKNVPIFQPSNKVQYVFSLLTGDQWDIDGKHEPIAQDLNKIIEAVAPTEMSGQIYAMKAFIDDQLKDEKYGPFQIGTAKLAIISKDLIDTGVYVYKRTDSKIEGDQTDYLVGIGGQYDTNGVRIKGAPAIVYQLPDPKVENYVSLVTSRIYDNAMNPVQTKVPFNVIQTADGKNFYVSTGKPKTGETSIYSTTTPLYTLFMDPALNPLKPPADVTKKMVDAGKTAQEAALMPLPDQWTLSSVGLNVSSDQKLGDFLNQKAQNVRTQINDSYNKWKAAYPNVPAKYREDEAGPFTWIATGVPQPILLKATSIQDMQKGNYIYQSTQYPEEYLALADAAGSTVSSLQNFASEFNPANPQRYAISLSNGNVYDRDNFGALATTNPVIQDLDGLLSKAVSSSSNKELYDKIKSTQVRAQAAQEFGPNTIFGSHKLFIDRADLQNGQFIYADITGLIDKFSDPFGKDRDALLKQVTDYFVTIETPGHVTLDKVPVGQAVTYGLPLSGKTDYIISFITGAIYDRSDRFAGFFEKYDPQAQSIELGFQKNLLNAVMATWKTTQNPQKWSKIQELSKASWDYLTEQRDILAKMVAAEAKMNTPLSDSTIANLIAAPYNKFLSSLPIPRYIKQGQNKYFAVSQDNSVFVDFNVNADDPNSLSVNTDTKMGKIYNAKGEVQLVVRDWILENMRAYNGIVVDASGKQSIDIAADHPSIPMKNMILLDANSLQSKLTAAQTEYNKELASYNKAAETKKLSDKEQQDWRAKLLAAATAAGYAQQELRAAKMLDPKNDTNLAKLGDIALSFYYNEDTANYFVRMQHTNFDVFYDLVSGFGFNPDGTPHISSTPVYKNLDPSAPADDYFFVGADPLGLFSAVFRGGFEDVFWRWMLTNNEQKVVDTGAHVYPLNSAPISYSADVIYDEKKDEYDVYGTGGDEAVLLGKYGKSNLVSTFINYVATRSKDNPTGVYSIGDEPQIPIQLIWDGKQDLNFQFILYPFDTMTEDELTIQVYKIVPLTAAGAGKFTASYKKGDGSTKTITVSKEQKQYSPNVTAHWINIIDGDKTFQFLYNTSILDPSYVSAACPTGASTLSVTDLEQLRTRLGFLKQCQWQLNVVVDSFGISRLVKSISSMTKRASIISPVTVPPTMANSASIQNEINANLAKVFAAKPAQTAAATYNRFVYILSAATDQNWAYYEPRFEGWYVDISNGILFDPSVSENGDYPYPRGALRASQLTVLLDRLGISVITDPQGNDRLTYRGIRSTPAQTATPAPGPAKKAAAAQRRRR